MRQIRKWKCIFQTGTCGNIMRRGFMSFGQACQSHTAICCVPGRSECGARQNSRRPIKCFVYGPYLASANHCSDPPQQIGNLLRSPPIYLLLSYALSPNQPRMSAHSLGSQETSWEQQQTRVLNFLRTRGLQTQLGHVPLQPPVAQTEPLQASLSHCLALAFGGGGKGRKGHRTLLNEKELLIIDMTALLQDNAVIRSEIQRQRLERAHLDSLCFLDSLKRTEEIDGVRKLR